MIIIALIYYQICFIPLFILSSMRSKPFTEYFENFPPGVLAISFGSILLVYGIILLSGDRLKKISLKKLLCILSPVIFLMIVSLPYLSRDTLSYLIPARNFVEFGRDPYLTSLSSVPQNQWTSYILGIWNHKSIYGPLFNILVMPFGLFTNLYNSILSYKIFSLDVFIGSLFVIKKLYGERAAIITLLNPVVLIHFVMEGHNDLFVFALFLVGLYFLTKTKNRFFAYLFLGLSISLKYYTVFLIPIFSIRNGRFNFREAAKCILVSAGVFFLLGLVFPGYFQNLLKNDIGFYTSRCIYSCSPISMLVSSIFPIAVATALKLIATITFFIVMIFRKNLEPIKWTFYIFMFLSFVYLNWLTPWFIIFPILFSAFKDEPKFRIMSYMLTVYALFHYFGI